MSRRVNEACLACGSVDYRTIRAYRSESPPGRRLFRDTVILECARCGLCQASPIPTDDELNPYYAIDYRAGRRYGADAANAATFPHDNLFFFHRGRSVAELLRSHLATDRPITVLDVGAGFGHILHALGVAFPQARRVAHELSNPCIAHLQSVGIEVVTGPLEDAIRQLPALDVVVLSHVLEHLCDPVKTLAMLRSHLAPGGLLFVEVPHMGVAQLSGYPDSPWAPRHDEPHLTFYDERTLAGSLRAAGFDVRFVSSAGPNYQEVSAWRYRLPPLLPTMRRLVPPSLMTMLRRSGSRHATLDHLAPAFDAYGGNRIWLRSVSVAPAG